MFKVVNFVGSFIGLEFSSICIFSEYERKYIGYKVNWTFDEVDALVKVDFEIILKIDNQASFKTSGWAARSWANYPRTQVCPFCW